jgi:hypothetical protein
MLFPWTFAQLLIGNGFLISSSGGGINFYLGNSPEAYHMYVEVGSGPEFKRLSDGHFKRVRAAYEATVGDLPAAASERFFYAEGIRYVAANPGKWLHLTAKKALEALRPWLRPDVYAWPFVITSGSAFVVIAAGAAGGLWAERGRQWRAVVISLAVLIGFVGASTLYLPMNRYRFVLVDVLLIIWLGIGWARLANRGRVMREA